MRIMCPVCKGYKKRGGGVAKRVFVYRGWGLPYFDRATVIANGNWYYTSALKSMGAKLCFHCCSVNIGPSYTQ